MAKQVFLLLTIFLCTISRAATYYISSSQGNDNNDGLSSGSAWQSLKKIGAFRGFSPGDKILLKAGDSFQGPLELHNSGSQSNPIYVSKYGSGANPVIYSDHTNAVWTVVPGHSGLFSTDVYGGNIAPNAVYDNAGNHYRNIKRGTDALDNWLNSFSDTCWGYDIPSKKSYIKTPGGSFPGKVYLLEFGGVRTYKDANYITFENLDIRNSYNGFFIPSDGCIVRGCNIQDVVLQGIRFDHANGGEAAQNTITRTGETSIYELKSTNIWIHHNTISYTTGTFLDNIAIVQGIKPERCGIGMQQGANNLVEYNNLSNLKGSFFDYFYEHGSVVRFNTGYNATACGSQHGTALQFYGNVLNVNGGTGLTANYHYDLKKNPASTETPILTYNNTILNFINYGLYSSTDSVIFRNNIVVTNSNAAYLANFYPGTNSDYNCFYFNSASSKGWKWGAAGQQSAYATFEAYRLATGQDAHSLFADPKFVSANPRSPDDFKLSASSPCLKRGQSLKSAGFSQQNSNDLKALSVAQDATPDIGAY